MPNRDGRVAAPRLRSETVEGDERTDRFIDELFLGLKSRSLVSSCLHASIRVHSRKLCFSITHHCSMRRTPKCASVADGQQSSYLAQEQWRVTWPFRRHVVFGSDEPRRERRCAQPTAVVPRSSAGKVRARCQRGVPSAGSRPRRPQSAAAPSSRRHMNIAKAALGWWVPGTRIVPVEWTVPC